MLALNLLYTGTMCQKSYGTVQTFAKQEGGKFFFKKPVVLTSASLCSFLCLYYNVMKNLRSTQFLFKCVQIKDFENFMPSM
jgi:hypothetical protein